MQVPGDTNVHVQVNGTTFAGIYEIVGLTVELMSADFGDYSTTIAGENAQSVAEQLLRSIAEQAIRDGAVFVRDDDM